nr:hypothetical protein [uncultured Bacteroides sp.]
MSNEANIDSTKVLAMFNEFNSKERKQTLRNALRKAATILRKSTINNLKNVVKNVYSKNKWNQKTLSSGIRLKVNKEATEAKVHLLGDFRLKFFELGTIIRINKKRNGKKLNKEANRGSIIASHFFATAKQQSESEVFASIDNIISDAVNKINSKYK